MGLTRHTNLAYRQVIEISCLCRDTAKGLFQSEPESGISQPLYQECRC